MAVITISKELGSGGIDIAHQVAQRLGYDYVDKHTTDAIFRQYGLTKFNELYSSAPSFLDILNADNLLLVLMANEITEAVAKRGNVVIQGRAGFAVLADYTDVLHVRIQAPLAARIRQLTAQEHIASPEAAEERLRDDDHVHKMYVQRFYNKQWDAPENFALVIDTRAVPFDAAVAQIVAAAQALAQAAPGTNALTTASVAVDPVLASAVDDVMANPPFMPPDPADS